MIRILAIWVATLIVIGTVSPVLAQPTEMVQSCSSAFPGLWGEEEPVLPSREIDGNAIKTSTDFKRMTGTREAGFKIIKGGDFSGWDFSDIPLSRICFSESKLIGSKFAGVQANGIGFIKSDLSGADLREARMTQVLFRNAKLSKVNAQGADFTDGHFDGGWFEGSVDAWNIDDANMSGFTFACGITVPDGCPVFSGGDRMSAKKTNFTRATLDSFGLFRIAADGAILDRTIIGPEQLEYLAKAEIRGDIILRGGGDDVRVLADEAMTLRLQNTEQQGVIDRASFDCGKARSKVEKEICGDYAYELRAFDRDVADLYATVKAVDPGVKTSQRAWLRDRNMCNKEDYARGCIVESYNKRKSELLALIGEPDWLAKGEAALFIDETMKLPAAFSSSALYKKITPVLVGASMTEILVERSADGLYSIVGSSVGANAHTCGVSASNLYFDKQSGWYVPVTEGKPIPVFRFYKDRLEIFENGRADYKQYPDASDYASCGMRASFMETYRIAVDAATIEKIRKRFDEIM